MERAGPSAKTTVVFVLTAVKTKPSLLAAWNILLNSTAKSLSFSTIERNLQGDHTLGPSCFLSEEFMEEALWHRDAPSRFFGFV